MADTFVTPDGVMQAMTPDEVFAYLTEVVSLGDAARSSVIAILDRRGFSENDVDLILNGAAMTITGRILVEELFKEESTSSYLRTLLRTAEVGGLALSLDQARGLILQFHIQLCVSLMGVIHPHETLAELQEKLKRGFGK
jgi:hypothetical protein